MINRREQESIASCALTVVVISLVTCFLSLSVYTRCGRPIESGTSVGMC